MRNEQLGVRNEKLTGLDFHSIVLDMNELREHIVVNPEIRFGKPCIRGTRITVGDILQWLSGGMTEQEITMDYPELQIIHIRAALAFA